MYCYINNFRKDAATHLAGLIARIDAHLAD